MIGKQIRLNDYKFTYGRENIYLNVYGAFKNKKNARKKAGLFDTHPSINDRIEALQKIQ